MTQLFSAMYDRVNSLRMLFCSQQVYPPSFDFTDVKEICAVFPPAGNEDLAPPEPNGDRKR